MARDLKWAVITQLAAPLTARQASAHASFELGWGTMQSDRRRRRAGRYHPAAAGAGQLRAHYEASWRAARRPSGGLTRPCDGEDEVARSACSWHYRTGTEGTSRSSR